MTSSNPETPGRFIPFLLEYVRLHKRVVGVEEIVRLFLEANPIGGKIMDESFRGGKNA
jgi:hypothetical protein